jgi:glyoxylase-like metal-dependent hydrolase (beta-lactamase superfamily II)
VEVLKRIDVDAGKLKHLVLTHIHFDHASGVRLFPKANIYIQEREYRFWIKDPVAKRAPFLHVSDLGANQYLKKLEGSKRLHLLRGDKKILPGIELLFAPGHTPGMQAIAVNTSKGRAIVGSDVAHFAVSYRNDIPSAIITDLRAWMKTFDKLRAKASSLDLMFPGHDPALLKDFPKVAEDVVRLA